MNLESRDLWGVTPFNPLTNMKHQEEISMKKFIALLLASVMVLGLFAMGVSAETTGAEDKIVIMAPLSPAIICPT